MTPLRVLVADDAPMIREALIEVLQRAGHTTIGVDNPDALLRSAALEAPDVAVIDIRMPPTHTLEGLVAARTLRRTQPGLGTMLLSQRLEIANLRELMTIGTSGLGYLLKERVGGLGEFVTAVERVAAGEVVIDADVVNALTGSHNPKLTGLAPRDLDVLRLVAQGLSNRGIATELGIVEKTVENRVSVILDKLGLSERAHENRRVLAVLTYLRHERE